MYASAKSLYFFNIMSTNAKRLVHFQGYALMQMFNYY